MRAPKLRWESLHPIMGLSELHLATGKQPYRKAFEQLWWSIVRGDRHNTGGFSSGEKATGNPYAGGAIETCCTIAWIAMSVEMLRLTGDPIVADELELSNKLRVPHWSTATKCSNNGMAVTAEAGSYCVFDHRWEPGDRITLELDMRPRIWVGERECDGKASLYRGPILLASNIGAAELPTLDLARLDVTLVEPNERPDGCLLMVDVTDSAGHTLRLSDFGSAAHNQSPYQSWLEAKGVAPVPFAPRNP